MTSEFGKAEVFDLARRGYDRRQVDDHMGGMSAQLADVRAAHQQERQRADRAEHELRNTRIELERIAEEGEAAPAQGFGYRVERLMRTAENEAAEVRSSAAREATALLERARADAEAHRHKVEHSLITRTAALDQEAAQRKVELDERERQITEHNATARDEADRTLGEVRRQAERLHQEAQVRAEQERAAAEQGIHQRRVAAEKELARLRGLHDDVRGQLARLLDALATEFNISGNGPRGGQRELTAGEQPVDQDNRPQPHPRQPPRPRAHPQSG